ncbi:MAG: phosphodiesterase [Gemmatales bacterium]|nr:MAG: phosphodiesterase [Gemmatales bacterium]
MLLGVLSDTHNRVATVEKALGLLQKRGVDWVVHCGDIEDADVVRLFAGWNAHFVFGNCDHDREGLRRAMRSAKVTLHEPFGDLELAGKKIAFVHGDDRRLLFDIEQSGHFDFLFYGHTHVANERQNGSTRIINPGALHRARPKTMGILDVTTGAWESIVVAD